MSASEQYQLIQSEIKKVGYSIVGITEGVPYYYTVGAAELIGFELFVEALPPETAERFIRNLISIWSHTDSSYISDVIEVRGIAAHGFRVGLVKVDVALVKSDKVLFATAHHSPGDFDLFQFVLPDKDNTLPWEKEFNAEGLPSQTVYRQSLINPLESLDNKGANIPVLDFAEFMVKPKMH